LNFAEGRFSFPRGGRTPRIEPPQRSINDLTISQPQNR
jgi:hypothetical protein